MFTPSQVDHTSSRLREWHTHSTGQVAIVTTENLGKSAKDTHIFLSGVTLAFQYLFYVRFDGRQPGTEVLQALADVLGVSTDLGH